MTSNRDFSLWRVPNLLLETRDSFLGEPVAHVEALNRWRTWLGVLTIAGAAAVYPVLAKEQPDQITGPARNSNVFYYANYFANWTAGMVAAVVMTAFYLILFSFILLLAVRARRATLRTLARSLAAMASFFGLFAAASLAQLAAPWVKHLGFAEHVVAYLVQGAVFIIALVWIIKALYLAAMDVFRANDGHPMLGPLVSTAVVWTMAAIASAQGGTEGVPRDVGLALAFGGPVTVTGLNVYACAMIWRKYHALLFRNGPPAASGPAMRR
jgi:hypothetical protein